MRLLRRCRADGLFYSTKDSTRPQSKDIESIKDEFRSRERCQVSRFKDCSADSESHGFGRGNLVGRTLNRHILMDVSKTKSQVISKTLQSSKKDSSRMMIRHRNMEISCSYYSQNQDISPTSVDWSQWLRLILCCRL